MKKDHKKHYMDDETIKHNRNNDDKEALRAYDEELDELDELSDKQDNLQKTIDKLKEELKENKNEYIKVHADLQNYAKRLEKDKATAIDYAMEGILKDFIGVVDNLERAIDMMKQQGLSEDISTGIDLTLKQVLSIMAKHETKEIDCTGKFDPNHHDAVMLVDDEESESGEIKEVLQKGYIYKGRVIRAAMVKVVK